MWLIAPIGVVQGIYAKYFGLPLPTIAAVILCARLFDAISDPLVGYYSDRYHHRTGTRKPFILIGGLLFIVSSYFLYVPYGINLPEISDGGMPIASVSVSPIYFASWFIAFFMAWTLFEIPHIAWTGELAPRATDKVKIYSYRAAAQYFGMLLFFIIPMLPVFKTSDITPASLEISVITASILMLFFLAVCLKVIPDNYRSKNSRIVSHELRFQSSHKILPESQSTSIKQRKMRISQSLAGVHILCTDIIANKPFLLFVTAYLLTAIGTGMWYGLLFIYVDAYLDQGEKFAPMFVIALIGSILATPLWCYLGINLGKKTIWMMAMALIIFGFIYTGTLSPDKAGFDDLVFLQVIMAVGYGCTSVVAPTMVSEIADYGTWKGGVNRPASYFALFTFTHKTAGAISSALGLSIAGWYGFDATANTQTNDAVFGVTLAITWIPVSFAAISLIFIGLSPITIRRHIIIRRRLDNLAYRINEKTPLIV